ncbi:unnamed protein product [Pedinophyceae sp. YPF-701]|nr:unnamed protein product [Pedinophyceae sp. YPF-701]
MSRLCVGAHVAPVHVARARVPGRVRHGARPFHGGALTARPEARIVTARATKQSFGSFDEMIAGCDVPVLVDFYAKWCGPCQLVSKEVLPQLSKSLGDKVKIVKIDSDKYPDLCTRFRVEGLPTMVLFVDGKEVERIPGAMPAWQLDGLIRKYI